MPVRVSMTSYEAPSDIWMDRSSDICILAIGGAMFKSMLVYFIFPLSRRWRPSRFCPSLSKCILDSSIHTCWTLIRLSFHSARVHLSLHDLPPALLAIPLVYGLAVSIFEGSGCVRIGNRAECTTEGVWLAALLERLRGTTEPRGKCCS